MTIYALMDTPSMTGAYRFDITPGDFTVMEVACTLFARKGAKPVQKIGLGALTSMFLFGETENGRSADYRPEVHDSDGLIFLDADLNWFWSPLANPRRLAINEFRLNNPRGFGLMQRDALFDHYQDLEARYEMRPSLWVEPKGDWGEGRLELIEIPSEEEIHDNMVAFWAPDKTADTGEVPEGQDAAPKIYPETMSYAYRLVWMPPGANPHGLGWATATRTSRQDDKLRFVIDFEGGELEDPWEEPGPESYIMAVPVEKAPDEPEYITIDFEKGDAVALNGKRLSPMEMVMELNKIAGKHGIGRLDMVENRFVGMKSRGVYETPGGTVLHVAHQDLEGICLDREALAVRDTLMPRYAAAVYNGFWFSPEREAMQALIDKSQEGVTGSVRLKLYKGTAWPVGRYSPHSLYCHDLATFEECATYDHKDAAGFIRLQGLRTRGYADRVKRFHQ